MYCRRKEIYFLIKVNEDVGFELIKKIVLLRHYAWKLNGWGELVGGIEVNQCF